MHFSEEGLEDVLVRVLRSGAVVRTYRKQRQIRRFGCRDPETEGQMGWFMQEQ